MNKCFRCGTEFEGKFCPECGAKYEVANNATEEQAIATNSTVDAQAVTKVIFAKIKDCALKYGPVVLFSLWAVLLWAFYAAKITTIDLSIEQFDFNLYKTLNDESFEDLFPVLNALLSFAIISNVYIVALGLVTWKGNKTAKLIVNCGGILLQLAVFICALVTMGKVKELELDQGDFVAVVSSLTAIFAALQVLIIIITVLNNRKKSNTDRKTKAHYVRSSSVVGVEADYIPYNRKYIDLSKEFEQIINECEEVSENTPNNLTLITKENYYQSDIASITIPNSVTEIGNNAFYGCINLEKVIIPSSVVKIGNGVFAECGKLKKIYYIGTMQQWTKIKKSKFLITNTDIEKVVCINGIIYLPQFSNKK